MPKFTGHKRWNPKKVKLAIMLDDDDTVDGDDDDDDCLPVVIEHFIEFFQATPIKVSQCHKDYDNSMC